MTNIYNPCLSLEQSIELRRLTNEITARNKAEKRERMAAIEDQVIRKQAKKDSSCEG